MGACTFGTVARGATASDAFNTAVDEARYEYGHGGYTGTIAEKDSFKIVKLSKEVIKDKTLFDAKIDELLDEEFDDKWGPAGCVQLEKDKFYFFGWASE